MGHDPTSDWLTEPFHRDRNSLLVAAEAGFGTVNLDEIDFQSEVERPVGKFYAALTDSYETVISWRRTTAEQALYYLDHKREIVDKYAGEYVLLQQGRRALAQRGQRPALQPPRPFRQCARPGHVDEVCGPGGKRGRALQRL